MANLAIQELFTQYGVPLLTREQGTTMFLEQLSPTHRGELVTVLGPTTAIHSRWETIPSEGITIERKMIKVSDYQVIRDHAFGGYCVLPMSGAVGWCISVVERLYGGRPVVEARNIAIHRGLIFDGTEHDRFLLQATPEKIGGHDVVTVTISSENSSGKIQPRYEGQFVLRDEILANPVSDTAPTYALPSVELSQFDQNAAYSDGLLFHGPTLRGIGPVLADDASRIVIAAQLAEPPFPGFDGQYFHGGTADLLPQGVALLGKRLTGQRILPISATRIEMFEPLPNNVPFLIVVELVSENPLNIVATVTACDPTGRIFQRWHGLSGLVAAAEFAKKASWIPAEMTEEFNASVR